MKVSTCINSIVLLLIASLSFPSSSLACLNDRDTLAEEVTGLPDVVQVITGRFERNPPLYYQMRLQRVSGELQVTPTLLGDYDDAGVACDRLGRDDEAIAWMQKKRQHLPPLATASPDIKEQWYRYYANIGTARVHRWLRAGADRSKITEVQRARYEIAQAITIKPNAHLGREKYQLQVMDWIIAGQPYRAETVTYYDGTGTHSYQQPVRSTLLADNIGGRQDVVQGLMGLIALGNAWESVDIFYALSQRLRPFHESHIANLAKLRCAELIDQGQGMIVPGAPRGNDLKQALRLDQSASSNTDINDDRQRYKELRAEAEQWQEQRTAYMMTRLLAGRHPDTDPTFWNAYHDPGPPKFMIPWGRRVTLGMRHVFGSEQIGFIVLLSLPFIGYYIWSSSRTRKRWQQNKEASTVAGDNK